MTNPQFDDLRPYRDDEIAPAMQRISESEHFPLISSYIYPDRSIEDVKKMIRSYNTIDEFQSRMMKDFNEQVVGRSIGRLTFEGIEKLDRERRYLFVSNHRDIMLDATLLQYVLHISGHRTSEISFGSNLMCSQLIVDIGKSNKMYKIIRGGNMKDFYNNSLQLSQYIGHALLEKKESVWIAQSNGRSKNGVDVTEPGIIKMFYMSNPTQPAKYLAELNITPVSISYQWETCDLQKALELYCRKRDGGYVKKADEDLNSILNGIMQYKGDVHLNFGTPLSTAELAAFDGLPNGTFNRQVAALIDRRILGGYRLSCNNYIARDLLSGVRLYENRYTAEQLSAFTSHYNKAMSLADVEDRASLSEIFLRIYASPIDGQSRIPAE